MKYVLLAPLLLVSTALSAQQTACPLVLPEGYIQVPRPHAGWRAATTQAHLYSAGMLSGPQEEQAYLIPSKTTTRMNETSDTWLFDAGGEKWLWCAYGGEVVKLFRRMDDATIRCELKSKEKRKGVYLSMTLECTQ